MHKGRGFARRSTLSVIRKALHSDVSDILFLQEVVGEQFARKTISSLSHHQQIAEGEWPYSAYGKNLSLFI